MNTKETLIPWDKYLKGYMTQLLATSKDASHDILHVNRVHLNAKAILVGSSVEDSAAVDLDVLYAAILLHDVDMTPKDSPDRHLSSLVAATKARVILNDLPDSVVPFPKDKIDAVCDAIQYHSYSYEKSLLAQGIVPELSLEARILQDADRLDALGVPGIARMFYVSGRIGIPSFHVPLEDSIDETPLDESKYVMDHLLIKKRELPSLMKTEAGKELGEKRLVQMTEFLKQLESNE